MLNSEQCKWTIGMVAYHSDTFIKWQLKILYELNNPTEFQLIIVDNSSPHQKGELSALIKEYQQTYNNIFVIYHNPKEQSASGQHGESLTIIQKLVNTKYFLAQDPDFFWLQKNYLKIFEEYFDNGVIAIGAPYTNKVAIGAPDFPSAWGCAYQSKFLTADGIDFTALTSIQYRNESWEKFPDYEFSYDVGWKVRKALSSERYVSFLHKPIYLNAIFKKYAFECVSREYFLNNKTIAVHLFRANFTGTVTQEQNDPKLPISSSLKNVRDYLGRFYYELASGKINDYVFSLIKELSVCENKNIQLENKVIHLENKLTYLENKLTYLENRLHQLEVFNEKVRNNILIRIFLKIRKLKQRFYFWSVP